MGATRCASLKICIACTSHANSSCLPPDSHLTKCASVVSPHIDNQSRLQHSLHLRLLQRPCILSFEKKSLRSQKCEAIRRTCKRKCHASVRENARQARNSCTILSPPSTTARVELMWRGLFELCCHNSWHEVETWRKKKKKKGTKFVSVV